MRKVHFVQADVFSDSPFGGNPVVIVPDPGPMTSEEMQGLARGMTFAETAFVTEATLEDADAAIRCFTPTTELAYSGHQLLGAAYVLATSGRIDLQGDDREVEVGIQIGKRRLPVIVQRNEAGEIRRVFTVDRPAKFGGKVEDLGALAAALSIDPMAMLHTGVPAELVDTGLPSLIVPVAALSTLREMLPMRQALDELLQDMGAACALVYSTETHSPLSHAHVRVFAPPLGIDEDPATGSANGALAAHLLKHGVVQAKPEVKLRSEQGSEMGRPSVVEMSVDTTQDPPRVLVGGRVQRSVEGSVFY